ncbi:hypothetical protein RB195_025910 [Necator americanus]|uniref:Uncharacterized protein n=1 Tax=Necator americanus TaxID=51031 RepID=A0ABR1EWK5_NECAM
MGNSLLVTPEYTLLQYPAHWALPSRTSGSMETDQDDACAILAGDCSRLRIYDAKTVFTVVSCSDLHALLGAVERIKFHVIFWKRPRARGTTGLRTCAERASKPLTTNLDRISKTAKKLMERRRTLRLGPSASNIEWQRKILDVRRSTKKNKSKVRSNTKKNKSKEVDRSRRIPSSTPVLTPITATGVAPPRILSSEVRLVIKSMKPGTIPDLI